MRKVKQKPKRVAQARPKRAKKAKPKNIIIMLILIFGVCGAILMAALLMNQGTGYRIEGPATQYYGGQTYAIDPNSHLTRDLEDNTILTQENSKREMTSLVVYVEEEHKIVLPKDDLL